MGAVEAEDEHADADFQPGAQRQCRIIDARPLLIASLRTARCRVRGGGGRPHEEVSWLRPPGEAVRQQPAGLQQGLQRHRRHPSRLTQPSSRRDGPTASQQEVLSDVLQRVHDANEEEALLLESYLINQYRPTLDNKVSGHHEERFIMSRFSGLFEQYLSDQREMYEKSKAIMNAYQNEIDIREQ